MNSFAIEEENMFEVEVVRVSTQLAPAKTLKKLDSTKSHEIIPHFIFATTGYHGIGS